MPKSGRATTLALSTGVPRIKPWIPRSETDAQAAGRVCILYVCTHHIREARERYRHDLYTLLILSKESLKPSLNNERLGGLLNFIHFFLFRILSSLPREKRVWRSSFSALFLPRLIQYGLAAIPKSNEFNVWRRFCGR